MFDPAGTELKSASVPYACVYPGPGRAEQEPRDFWAAAVAACGRVFEDGAVPPEGIAVVGLSGHMNGCLAVDADGEALRPELIHSDSRSSAECADILHAFDAEAVYALTGNRVDEHLSLPKILWIKKNEADVYRRTAFFVNSKDYLRFRLTGIGGGTDFSDASLVNGMDLRAKRWATDFLGDLGLDPAKFPEPHRSSDLCGGLTAGAARELGLRSGIPVVYGGGDAACATRGAGVVDGTEAYANIGSSAWISTLAAGPVIDPRMRMQNFYDLDGTKCNVCGTVQSAGIAADWATALFSEDYGTMDPLAAAVPPGAEGILFAPYLMGERTPHWDSQARGSFIGLSLSHGKAAMMRAVYEGVAYALKDVFSVYPELGFPLSSLTLLGGGAKSRLWRRIIADVLGCPVSAHRTPSNATSLGAAMAAGVGVGIFNSFEEAALMARRGPPESPDPTNAAVYGRIYPIFKELYAGLRPLYRALNDLTSNPPALP